MITREIYDVLVGGNHLTSVLLGFNVMPSKIATADELEGFIKDVWIAWKMIMQLRDSFTEEELDVPDEWRHFPR